MLFGKPVACRVLVEAGADINRKDKVRLLAFIQGTLPIVLYWGLALYTRPGLLRLICANEKVQHWRGRNVCILQRSI